MTTLQKTLIALATGSLLSVSAQAAVNYTGTPYVGVKAGQFMLDDDGTQKLDKATAYGVYGGYNFDPNFGVEVEFLGSDDADVRVNGVDGEYDVKTYGAYGTYRYYLPNASGLYAKGKLGIAKTEADVNYSNGTSTSSDDTGIAGGIGLGLAVNNNMSIEGEYAMADSDIDSKLWTVGAHLKF